MFKEGHADWAAFCAHHAGARSGANACAGCRQSRQGALVARLHAGPAPEAAQLTRLQQRVANITLGELEALAGLSASKAAKQLRINRCCLTVRPSLQGRLQFQSAGLTCHCAGTCAQGRARRLGRLLCASCRCPFGSSCLCRLQAVSSGRC